MTRAWERGCTTFHGLEKLFRGHGSGDPRQRRLYLTPLFQDMHNLRPKTTLLSHICLEEDSPGYLLLYFLS